MSTPAIAKAQTLASELESAVTLAADNLAEGLSVNALEELAGMRAKILELEELAAVHARSEGHSWEVIAEAAGISKQAAHKRWNRAAHPAPSRPRPRPGAPLIVTLAAQLAPESTDVDPYGTTPLEVAGDRLEVPAAGGIVEPAHPARVVDPERYDCAQELLAAVTQTHEAEARVELARRRGTELHYTDAEYAAQRLAHRRLADARTAAAELLAPTRPIWGMDLQDLERLAVRTLGELAGLHLAQRKGRK